MKKKVLSIGVIVLFTIMTIYVFATSKELQSLPEMMKTLNYGWLSIAGVLMVVYYVFNTLLIQKISQEVGSPIRFMQALYMSFVGQYYSLITPFASGGQPAQVYAMQKKFGIPLSKGTTITVKKFIVYQVVVSLFAIGMFVYKIGDIVTQYSNLLVFIVIGLIVNLVGGIGILLIAYNAEVANRFVSAMIRGLKRLRVFKKINEERISQQIDEYAHHIEGIRQNKKTMFTLVVYTVLQLLAFFSITYFVYRSLGQNHVSYMDILAIQTIVYVVVSFIPTPGGAGASEGGFVLLFKGLITGNALLYGMAIWRIIIYYINILISGLVVVVDKIISATRESALLQDQ